MREEAPIIFFDVLQTWAASPGIGHFDVGVTVVEPGATPAKTSIVPVAHLRFPLAMLPVLKHAIQQIELVEKPVVGKA